jgi:hypothetical protein
MKTSIVFAGVFSLAVALAAVLSPQQATAAHHEPVLMAVTVDVAPGRMQDYQKAVKQLQGVMTRLGGGATVRMWNVTAGGPDSGSTVVGVQYPNAAAWASLSEKSRQDAEWQKIVAGLDGIRTIKSVSILKDITPNPSDAPAGSVLVGTGVRVKPGKLDEYLSRISGSRAISERLGMGGRLRVWQSTLAGPGTGAVFIGVEYPDLGTYVSSQAKLESDPEWQKLISGLGDLRSVEGRWLYQEVTP